MIGEPVRHIVAHWVHFSIHGVVHDRVELRPQEEIDATDIWTDTGVRFLVGRTLPPEGVMAYISRHTEQCVRMSARGFEALWDTIEQQCEGTP